MNALESENKLFTCIWKIKNFSFFCNVQHWVIEGPSFLKNERNLDQLFLRLRSYGNFITCSCAVKLPFSFPVNFELAILSHGESTVNHVEISDTIVKDSKDSVPLLVQIKKILLEDRAVFLPNDTLTVQCKIWAAPDSELETGQISAETEIEVQRLSSVWNIEKFSRVFVGEKIAWNVLDKSEKEPFFIFSFFQENGFYFIQIEPLGAKSVKFCKCQFFLVDANNKRIICGTHSFPSSKGEIFILSLASCNLFRNNDKYLPNDVLTLHYEIEFSTGGQSLKILDTDLSSNAHVSHSSPPDNSIPSVGKCAESSLSWRDDLFYILQNGFIFDTCLKTSSETFPVHSLILHIRSPVFSDLLTKRDNESLKEGIYIGNLDAETVCKMILYLYTDINDVLDWVSAKNLYVASHEYEITSLKEICSYYLKTNLEFSNCCDILRAAKKCKDSNLILEVENFISKHAKAILVSEAWRDLEKMNPVLACETLRTLYLKN